MLYSPANTITNTRTDTNTIIKAPLQEGLVTSLLPSSPGLPSEEVTSGQLLAAGLFSGVRCQTLGVKEDLLIQDPVSNWLCAAAMAHVFMDNPGVQVIVFMFDVILYLHF